MERGHFIISLDFELFWGAAGWSIKDIQNYSSHYFGAIRALKGIVDTFKKYDIKCTIAYVGAINHKDYNDFITDIPSNLPDFSNNLYSTYNTLVPLINKVYPEKYFFASSLIKDLAENQLVELASHTFSHFCCLESGYSIDSLVDDIKKTKLNAERIGVNLTTLILPRNQIIDKHKAIYRNLGFTHFRGNFEDFLYNSKSSVSKHDYKRIFRFIDSYVNISGYNTYPLSSIDDNGMKNIKGSRFLRPYIKSLRCLEPLKIRRIKKSMLYAAKNHEVYHLWWHPHNFGTNTNENLKELEELCKYYTFLHSKYGLTSSFIKDI